MHMKVGGGTSPVTLVSEVDLHGEQSKRVLGTLRTWKVHGVRITWQVQTACIHKLLDTVHGHPQNFPQRLTGSSGLSGLIHMLKRLR